MGPSNPTPMYLPKRNEDIHLYKSCTQIFTVALFIGAKWEPKWMDKENVASPLNGMCFQ